MQLIPLIEDSKVKNFKEEKGLSLFIQTKGIKIIFDTGFSKKFIENAKKLEIKMDKIDYFIISHGHRDHCGGLQFLDFRIKTSKPIFLEKRCLNREFSFNFMGIRKKIGKNDYEINGIEFKDLFKITDELYLIKTLKKEKNVKFEVDGKIDDFNHEIHLVVLESNHINVITGCCHSGIFNLIDSLKEYFPNKKINAIIGGLHTRSYILHPIKLIKLIIKLKKYKETKLILGHCTGKITIFLFSILKKSILNIKIGKEYIV